MRRPHPIPKRQKKQIKLNELEGIVVLQKKRNAYDASDLETWKVDLESSKSAFEKLTILRKLFCIEVSNEVIEKSQITGILIELVFHKDSALSVAAAKVLQHWQNGNCEHIHELHELPIGLKEE